jgi:hypothetical protein
MGYGAAVCRWIRGSGAGQIFLLIWVKLSLYLSIYIYLAKLDKLCLLVCPTWFNSQLSLRLCPTRLTLLEHSL